MQRGPPFDKLSPVPLPREATPVNRFLPLAALLLAPTLLRADAPEIPPKKGEPETIALFDGKTLDNWEGHKTKYWTVDNGIIVGKNREAVPVSTYLLTKRKFSDFHLAFSAKLVESEMHSGI